MLILVYGSVGLDYLLSEYVSRGDFVLSTVCLEGDGGIDIDLTPGLIIRLSVLWSRILGLGGGGSRLLLDSLAGSRRLSESLDAVMNIYMDGNEHGLYFIARILRSLDLWRPLRLSSCINSPMLEPIRSLVTAVAASYLVEAGVTGGNVVLSTDYVDSLLDVLHELRGLGDIYVHSDKLPRGLGIFDEVLVTSEGLPRVSFGKFIKASGGRVREILVRGGPKVRGSPRALIDREVDEAILEVVRASSEVTPVGLESLVDMISQYNKITREEALLRIVKALSMGLVKLRELGDGRVVLRPTVRGLLLVKRGS